MLKVFVDADAFVASFNPSDTNREKAEKCVAYLENNNASLYTSELVLLETANVIINRVKSTQLKRIRDYVRGIHRSNYTILPFNSLIYNAGMKIFENQTSRKIGAFDCCHIATMKENGINLIFSFDDGYKKNKIDRVIDVI